jgi:drug/metabolite transporter (DMT)-like permease
MTVFLLILSIVLSCGRNLLSKKLSSAQFGSKTFFYRQGTIFTVGAITLLLLGLTSLGTPSPLTILFALIYGALLITAQWFYTIALGKGNTALCSTVYSMGFIIPTVSGAVFWQESLLLPDIVGILLAASAILCSKASPRSDNSAAKGYYLPLSIAMLASGGLGVMQKVQQKSSVSSERTSFLVIAFIIAAAASFFAAFLARKDTENSTQVQFIPVAAAVGVAFASCNLLNTMLAGRLPSSVFFPTLNIGVILLSMALGCLFFKERIRRKEITVLVLGVLSIILLAV